MADLSVLILAAGAGSRFGGNKQLASVGPNGETFLDYTIMGCQQVGIGGSAGGAEEDGAGGGSVEGRGAGKSGGTGKIVLVVRSDIIDDMTSHLEQMHDKTDSFVLVCQDTFGPPRDKPWGTAHAVLCAREEIAGPFIVANADDYYAPQAFQMLKELLEESVAPGDLSAQPPVAPAATPGGSAVAPGTPADALDAQAAYLPAALLGFELGNTLPASGAVTRGVCHVSDGYLQEIVETKGISRTPEGIFDEAGEQLSPETLVSLNLWGFDNTFFELLSRHWDNFLSAPVAASGDSAADNASRECLLPDAVAQAMASRELAVKVRRCDSRWIGVTFKDDLQAAQEAFQQI